MALSHHAAAAARPSLARVAPTRVASSTFARDARDARKALATRAAAASDALPSLDASSTWRLRLELFSGVGASSEPDRVVDARCVFVVDEGYEPPQGVVQIVEDDDGVFVDGGLHRWTLEEDPNERKAGLWIWGLFEEPLYPYMLLSFDVNRVEVREGGYHVPAGKLFGEMRHARGSKSGHVLSDGRLSFKVTKTYQADLVGLSKVSVGEPTECGRVRLDCVETF